MNTGTSLLEDLSSVILGSEGESDSDGESSSGPSDDDDAEEGGIAPHETAHGPEKDVAQNEATAGQIKLTSAFKRVIRHITNKDEKVSSRTQAFKQGTISMFHQLQEVLSIGGIDTGKATKRSLLDSIFAAVSLLL